MDVVEYAKYVINNMSRATIGNALNISNKFSNEYDFKEFLVSISKYLETLLATNSFSKDKCYILLSLVSKTTKKYNSEFKYNKAFIIDDFIIDLWKVLNGN